jgi:hypothetical protein
MANASKRLWQNLREKGFFGVVSADPTGAERTCSDMWRLHGVTIMEKVSGCNLV